MQQNGRTNKGKCGGTKGKPTETPRTGGNGRSKQTEKKNEEKIEENKVKVAAKNKGAAENEISDNKEEILSDPGTGVNSDEEEETVIQSDDKPKVLGQAERESNYDVSSQDESNIDKKEVIEKPGNDCENGAEQGSNVLKSGVNSGENSNRKEISDNKEILSDPGTGVNSDEETVIQSDDKPKVLGQVERESNDDVSSQDESNIDKKRSD